MRHKENHKQPLELKYKMCIYTNKNEAQLNIHKESHKDKELLKCYLQFCRRGPICDAEAQGKSQKVKEKFLMCGSILLSRQQVGSPIDGRPSTSYFWVLFGLDGEHFGKMPVQCVVNVIFL